MKSSRTWQSVVFSDLGVLILLAGVRCLVFDILKRDDHTQALLRDGEKREGPVAAFCSTCELWICLGLS
jgi:hypothetical protein